jgi:tRNA:m4X modification enzyme
MDTRPTKNGKKNSKRASVPSQEAGNGCGHYFPQKHRYCRIPCITNRRYCGHHASEEEDYGKEDSTAGKDHESSNKNKKRKRMPCPIDPRHSIYCADLERHIVKCPTKVQQDKSEQHFAYEKNINARQATSGALLLPPLTHERWQEAFSDSEVVTKFLAKVRNAAKTYIPHIPLETIKEVVRTEMPTQQEELKGNSDRHGEQNRAIVHHLQKRQLLQPDYACIELGAGRGGLSLEVSKVAPELNVTFIDRAGGRHKVDGHLPATVTHRRIRMDLRHVNFAKLCPCNQQRQTLNTHNGDANITQASSCDLVGYSKHLCGSATDLSLRGLTIDPAVRKGVKGIVIALCCHDKLSWEEYLHPDFMTNELGFSPTEFQWLMKLTSWATCCNDKKKNCVKNDSDKETPATPNTRFGLSIKEQREFGRWSKRLIDVGRVRYLQEYCQMEAKLVHYCTEDQSLENCLLVAIPQGFDV